MISDALIQRRASGKLRTTGARRADAETYIARHRQLRREIRWMRVRRAALELASVSVFIGAVLLLAGVANLPA